MSQRCVCGHDEDEHVEGIGCDAEVEAPDVFCACERFRPAHTDGAGVTVDTREIDALVAEVDTEEEP